MSIRRSNRARNPQPTPHIDLEYPSSVPTFTVNPTQLSSSSATPPPATPWFSAFGRADSSAPLPPDCDPKYSDPAYYASATYGKGSRNTSHTAKKPEGHIKRPPNCFLLFRSHVKEQGIRIPDELRPLLKERLREKKRESKKRNGGDEEDDQDDDDDDDQDDDEQSVSKISGILWDFLPAAEKSIFRARAAHAKAQHKKFYPTYKYSPQVKDKTVKKRVGKKMAADKRERLEEAASLMAQGLGWAAEGQTVPMKREHSSATSSSSTPSSSTPTQTPNAYPGTSSFPVPAYAHQPPPPSYAGPGQHPMARDDGSGTSNMRGAMGPPMSVPMSAVEPHWSQSSGLGLGIGAQMRGEAAAAAVGNPGPIPEGVRMYRRTSSCPPPGAHFTWNDMQSAPTGTPQPPTMQPWAYPSAQFTNMSPSTLPPPPPANVPVTFVRPGGKTQRKMRSGHSAKATVLGGNSSSEGKSSKKQSRQNTPSTSAGGMVLPSLPNVMAPSNQNTSVPMSALSYDSSEGSAAGWPSHSHYDYHASSNTSSPNTFASSAPASVLETPPFGQQLPQLQHGFQYPSQQYSFPGTGDQAYYNEAYNMNPDGFVLNQSESYIQPLAEEPAKGDDQLGLTMIEENYTFPPPPPRAPARADGSPLTNSFNTQERTSTKRGASSTWKAERPSPLSPNRSQTYPHAPSQGRNAPRSHLSNAPENDGNYQELELPYPLSPASNSAVPPSSSNSGVRSPHQASLVSPSPVTPISINMQQHHADSHHYNPSHSQQGHSLDNLGVDVNLNVPEGSHMGSDNLSGLLEFSFPGHVNYEEQSHSNGVGMIQEGYTLGSASSNGVIEGSAAGNMLLGDVALGVHEDSQGQQNQQQQQMYHQQPYMGPQDGLLGPLDIPLHELYAPDASSFDPTTYITDDHEALVAVNPALNGMSSAEALEYDMMEWRRGSLGAAGGATSHPPTSLPYKMDNSYNSRRASVQLSATFGDDMALALYGYDAAGSNAATPRAGGYDMSASAAYGMTMGMDFEFQPGPPPISPPYPQPPYHDSSSAGSAMYGNYQLGTVAEERERGSSEEAEARHMPAWVSVGE